MRCSLIGCILRVVVCASWFLIGTYGMANEDWSQWRGPHRDGVAPGIKPNKTWPQELERLWQVEVGLGHSSPVIAGDRVFIFTRQGDQEVVRALKLIDGQEIWHKTYAAPYEINPMAIQHGSGPRSTPVMADGRLYTLGITGILTCWDSNSGDLKWRKEFTKQFKSPFPLFGTAMSPLVDDGRLIVHIGSQDHGSLMALDVVTGEVQWSWDEDGPGYASPIVVELSGTRQVIAQTQNFCVGLGAKRGTFLWKVPLKTEDDQNAVTPVVYEGSVILSDLSKGIDRYRIEKDGDEWRTDNVWNNKEVSLQMSSPIASNERLYGFSHRQKGQLFALDITTGRMLWTSEGKMGESATLVRTQDVLWALTTQGELILFRDNEKEFEQLARYKVAETPTWSHPVVLDDSVLVKDEARLTKWRFRSTSPPPAAGTDSGELSRGRG